jgi:hypothetical protein
LTAIYLLTFCPARLRNKRTHATVPLSPNIFLFFFTPSYFNCPFPFGASSFPLIHCVQQHLAGDLVPDLSHGLPPNSLPRATLFGCDAIIVLRAAWPRSSKGAPPFFLHASSFSRSVVDPFPPRLFARYSARLLSSGLVPCGFSNPCLGENREREHGNLCRRTNHRETARLKTKLLIPHCRACTTPRLLSPWRSRIAN